MLKVLQLLTVIAAFLQYAESSTPGTTSNSYAGPPGTSGEQGPPGTTGEIGALGPKGAHGTQGSQGMKGDPGLQGSQGQKGTAGQNCVWGVPHILVGDCQLAAPFLVQV